MKCEHGFSFPLWGFYYLGIECKFISVLCFFSSDFAYFLVVWMSCLICNIKI